jgi:hypothetical protein
LAFDSTLTWLIARENVITAMKKDKRYVLHQSNLIKFVQNDHSVSSANSWLTAKNKAIKDLKFIKLYLSLQSKEFSAACLISSTKLEN